MEKEQKDFRQNQKVIMTLVLEDQGQDFIEIDVLENGVILGNSIMFKNGRLSMIGVGTLNGEEYWVFPEVKKNLKDGIHTELYIYFKDTGQPDPLPWKATTLKYMITGVEKAKKPNRFIDLKTAKGNK